MSGSVFIERIVIRNFKSIRECDVTLGPLTFLVGPNGSGKSNFVDAIRFVADAVGTTLDAAITSRGGYREVRRRSGAAGRGTSVDIALTLRSAAFGSAEWGIRLSAAKPAAYRVTREHCEFRRPLTRTPQGIRPPLSGGYSAGAGDVVWKYSGAKTPHPPVTPDTVYLTSCSGYPGFREIHSALRGMCCHNLSPHTMRQTHPPSAGERLSQDGANVAAVLRTMARANPQGLENVRLALSTVVPSVTDVEREAVGGMDALRFTVASNGKTARFYGAGMSDGTLRALGCLVALYHGGIAPAATGPPLVALEEPEIALHPAALRTLLECLLEASLSRQVVVTSHSTDLLDNDEIDTDSILAVVMEEGETRIGGIDHVGRQALAEGMFTAGELLRLEQLTPAEGGAK